MLPVVTQYHKINLVLLPRQSFAPVCYFRDKASHP